MSQQCILAIIIHFFLRVLRLFYSCFFRIVFLFRFYHLMFLWAHDRCFNSIKKQWWRLWNCEYLRLWCDSVVASFFWFAVVDVAGVMLIQRFSHCSILFDRDLCRNGGDIFCHHRHFFAAYKNSRRLQTKRHFFRVKLRMPLFIIYRTHF